MKKVIRLRLLLALFLSVFATIGFAAKYKPINEIPDQVPANEEEQGIWQVGKAHQQEVRNNGEVMNAPDLELYLEGIVSRMMGDMVGQIGMEVDVLVFKDTTVNAWVYPDGTIAVQTGLLAALENEAQLAAILGHEISHFLNRHAYIQIKSKQKQSVIGKGLGLLATAAVAAKTGVVDTGLMGTGKIWTELVTSGYSRKLETQADKQGLQLLAAAGYPPEEALPAFEQLRIKEDDQVNLSKMWSSHPDIDSRLKNLRRQIKKLKTPPPTEVSSSESYLQAVGKGVLMNGQLLLERRQFESAIGNFSRYANAHAADPVGFFLLAEAYRKQQPEGNYEARLANYAKAIEAAPDFAPAHKERGMAHRQMGQVDQAVAEFEQYLEIEPQAVDGPIIRWYIEDLQANGAPESVGGQ